VTIYIHVIRESPSIDGNNIIGFVVRTLMSPPACHGGLAG